MNEKYSTNQPLVTKNNKIQASLINSYIDEVGYWLLLSNEQKKESLDYLRNDIEEAIQDSGSSNLVSEFGHPYEVAKNLSKSQNRVKKCANYKVRSFAFLIDYCLIVILVLIGLLPWLYVVGYPYEQGEVSFFYFLFTLFIYLIPYTILCTLGYWVLFEKITSSTPGKSLFGLIVCDESGVRLTWTQALIRNLTKSQFEFILLEIFISYFLLRKCQRLLDTVAKTTVIHRQ
ncbi:MAG: RDD family protein [Promethearchaeota archaeon]